MGLDPLFEYDAIATIVSFSIYKEWLLLSLENKQRNANLDTMYYKSELQLRIDIYKLCSMSSLYVFLLCVRLCKNVSFTSI